MKDDGFLDLGMDLRDLYTLQESRVRDYWLLLITNVKGKLEFRMFVLRGT